MRTLGLKVFGLDGLLGAWSNITWFDDPLGFDIACPLYNVQSLGLYGWVISDFGLSLSTVPVLET